MMERERKDSEVRGGRRGDEGRGRKREARCGGEEEKRNPDHVRIARGVMGKGEGRRVGDWRDSKAVIGD